MQERSHLPVFPELPQICILSIVPRFDATSQQTIRRERYVGGLLLTAILGNLATRLSAGRLATSEAALLHAAIDITILVVLLQSETSSEQNAGNSNSPGVSNNASAEQVRVLSPRLLSLIGRKGFQVQRVQHLTCETSRSRSHGAWQVVRCEYHGPPVMT